MAGEIIQYQAEDGVTIVRLQERDGTVWLSQANIAELFQALESNINKHIKGIIADGEQPEATIEDYSIVRSEGARPVERQVAATCDDYLQVGMEGRREISRWIAHY